jgi:4,5-dihydroxyphthalate decarboxylase
LLDRCRAAGNPFPFGRTALDPAIALVLRYATEQGLLERPLTLDEVWAGLPAGCEE